MRGHVAAERWIGAVAAGLALAGSVLVGWPAAGPAPVSAAPVDVLAGAASLGSSVAYPDVAAGGGGVFHAVVRDSSFGTRIVYQQSRDAGRTWTPRAILSGSIGATRPSIAADGDHVAVAFVGEWVDGAGVFGEAPYLTTSDDGGASWTPARRLGTWAVDVDVAVDGDRVWAIWSGSGGVRGTTDGGATFFASQDLLGVSRALVAAGDGVVSAAYLDGAGDTMSAVGQSETLGAFGRVEHAVLQDVAAADGLAYTLVADGSDLAVLAASPGGAPARAPVSAPFGGSGTSLWADLAAGRGTIAVATCASGTVYVTESTAWPTFGEPVAATTFAGASGQPCRATITAPPTNAELQPRFDWSVAPRYVDTDGDGLAEPANASGTAADNVLVGANAVLRVTLDGCASLPAGGGVPITRYIWSIGGVQVADLDQCAGPTVEVDSGDRPQVRLEIRDDDGGRAVTTREIAPRDLVVVSLGDSVASGEGSPLRPQGAGGEVAWSDRSCHRSPYAGPALAAQQLEDADLHTSVTFIQLACSGAAVVDTYADPAQAPQAGGADDPVTGGVADGYAGVEHAETCEDGGACPSLRPSQLDQLQQLLGPRSADAVLVSVGANDVRFSSTLRSCLLGLLNDCDAGGTASEHDQRMLQLPARYGALAAGLGALGIAPDRVHITGYFDPTGDEYGLPNLRCVGHLEDVDQLDLTGLELVSDDEAIWAREHVVAGLNDAVQRAAADHGWNAIGGIAERFAAHGYCSTDPWIVRLGESFAQQDDEFGAFHPNRAGQEAYADAISTRLAALVQVPPVEVGDAPASGAAAVGDLVVLAASTWATQPALRSIALSTTGGQPTVGAVRQLQHGAGWGAVALDGSASVGVWAGEHGGFGAQLGSRPNAAVRDVHIVQGPSDGSRLVANRSTSVLANLWSSVDGPWTTQVTTTVVAHGDTGDTPLLGPVTEARILWPGRNDVLLPFDDTIDAPDGSVLVATVRVTDPVGAAEEDGADDELSTAPADFVPTITTRPVRVAFVPLDFGSGTVACGDIATAANTWVAWAQQLLPVPDGGIEADVSCLPELLAPSASEVGVLTALGNLDLLARVAGIDSVVGIVPDGWLGNALGDGSVGRAGVTGRSMLLEHHAPETAFAHELGHNLGLDHTPGGRASGAWVSRNRVVEGADFMGPSQNGVSTYWVSGDTWDLLTGSVAAGSEPTQPAPGGDAFLIRGSMPVAGDTVLLDPFLDDGNVPDPPPADGATSRLQVVPVAADGSPVGDPVNIGLDPDMSAGGSDAPTSMRFAQRVVAPAGTTAFRVLLDGMVVAERIRGAAPTVAVTSAPGAGTVIGRDGTIDVGWTVDDPDTVLGADPPSITLLISDDGDTWRPLASGLGGSSASLPVPGDVAGDAVRVRVVAADGMHVRWADSPPFGVEAVPAAPEGRLVFVAGDPDMDDGVSSIDGSFGFPRWDQIGTMRPDGTDVQFLPLPTTTMMYGTSRPAIYASPIWGPDGRVYFRSIETVATGDACTVVDSVNADGTDRRREVSPAGSVDCETFRHQNTTNAASQCLSMSADGTRMLVNTAVFDRVGTGWTRAATLTWDNPFSPPDWYGIVPFSSGPDGVSSDQCPMLSADGEHVARVVRLHGHREADAHSAGGYGSALAVAVAHVDAEGSSVSPWISRPRIVTAWDETLFRDDGDQAPDQRALGVSWLDDHHLLVARGSPGWDAATLERLDLSSLTPAASTDAVLTPAVSTPMSTVALPATTARHRDPKPTPDGGVYGDVTCGFYAGEGAVTVYPSSYTPGTSTCFREVAWLGAGAGGGGDEVITIDPELAPDPDPEQATDPVVIDEGGAAPGAGSSAVHPVPVDVLPDAVSITPGEDLDLELTNELGVPARYELDPSVPLPAGAGTLTVIGAVDPATGLIVTSGPLRLRVDDATATAAGVAQLRVRAAGAADFDTIEVRLATPPRPAAADDQLAVQVGVEATFPPSALLANDSPSRPGVALRLVHLSGYGGGAAFLGADGMVHVAAGAAGTSTLRYAVAEVGSTGYTTAVVTVTATDDAAPATTTTTTTTTGPPRVPNLVIELSTSSARRGEQITITGSGFVAGDQVGAVMHSGEPFDIGSAIADASGRVVFHWTVPATAAVGEHTVVLTGAASGSVEHALSIVGPDPDAPAAPPVSTPPAAPGVVTLPRTGADSSTTLVAGLGLLAGGTLLVTVTRTRRRRRGA